MMNQTISRKVDQSALRVNQAFIIGLLVMAFVVDWVWLVAFVGVVMLLGTAVPSLALFQRIYHHLLKPSGLLKPDVVDDNPEPHRFAQGFGGVVVVVSVAALMGGLTGLGWVLTAVVIILAALNLFLGFCAGCFLYYQLHRWGVRGFSHAPIRS